MKNFPEKFHLPQWSRKKWTVVLVVGGILFALCALALSFLGRELLGKLDAQAIRDWVDSLGVMGHLAFVGGMCLQAVIPFLPAEPFEIAAGYAFGAGEGLLVCTLANALSTVLIFFLVRRFGMKLVNRFVSPAQLQQIPLLNRKNRLYGLMFVLFLIPGTPKDALLYLCGLTPVRLAPFLLLSGAARVPSILSSTMGGDALGQEQYLVALAVFAVTGLLSLIGVWAYRRRHGKPAA